MSVAEVARKFQVSTASTTIQTNKVMDADLAESGEERLEVKAAYWPRKE